jgi:hypothetical protein
MTVRSDAPPTSELSHVVIRPYLAVAIWGRVHLQSWLRFVTSDDVLFAFKHAQSLARPGGDKFATLAIGGQGMTLPDDETRKLAAEHVAKFDALQSGSAIVIDGEGFFAGAARAMISGISMLSRTRVPQRAFRTSEEGAVWLASLGALEPVKAPKLAAALRDLRARHVAAHGDASPR